MFLISETIDERGLQDMLAFIEDLGGWPVLNKTWQEDTYDLEARVAQARHYTTNHVWPIAHGIMMGLNILNDFKVYGRHTIYVSTHLIITRRYVYKCSMKCDELC